MIDLESVQETGDGTRFDRLTALLIGLIAVLASALAVVQTAQSQTESRTNILVSRTTIDLASRLAAGADQQTFRFSSEQRAVQVAIEGTSRQIVAFDAGDAVDDLKGEADTNAGTRLQATAVEMGAIPDSASPIDPYARGLLSTPLEELFTQVAEQNRLVKVANDAGTRSGRAVLGLSMTALAGVLVGLAAVLGQGRAGRLTLVMAYLAAGAGTFALTSAVL